MACSACSGARTRESLIFVLVAGDQLGVVLPGEPLPLNCTSKADCTLKHLCLDPSRQSLMQIAGCFFGGAMFCWALGDQCRKGHFTGAPC